MTNKYFSDKAFDEYLKEFYKKPQPVGEKLKFEKNEFGVICNATAPFVLNGKKYIAGRAEKKDEILKSVTLFFEEKRNNVWTLAKDAPVFKLEDPSARFVDGKFIFSGVEVIEVDKNAKDFFEYMGKKLTFYTVFFKTDTGNLKDLKRFSRGPNFQKDVRFLQLSNGEVLFATRPMRHIQILDTNTGKEKKFLLRQIGFTKLESLDELKDMDRLKNAHILKNFFPKEAWGGVNDMHILNDEHVGILGHVGKHTEEGGLHYHAISFIYNHKTEKATDYKIVSIRDNFPAGPTKRKELKDVIFSGQAIKNNDGRWTLYSGLSDIEMGKIIIEDPFKD